MRSAACDGRASEGALLGGAGGVRLQPLDARRALHQPVQPLAELGYRGAAAVAGERLGGRPLLDHNEPVGTLVQGVEQAALVLGVYPGDHGLQGGDHLGSAVGKRADRGDNYDGHQGSFLGAAGVAGAAGGAGGGGGSGGGGGGWGGGAGRAAGGGGPRRGRP